MIEHLTKVHTSQFEASLCMLNDCIQQCAPEHWDGTIARYPFWHVAYHTLCFADLYLSPDEASFRPRDIHPRGMCELDDEYPSRRFEKQELTVYAVICRQKALETLASETRESLEGPSGFPRLRFSRAELHVYSIRHMQHHIGQLSAYLRRADDAADPRWVGTGWR